MKFIGGIMKSVKYFLFILSTPLFTYAGSSYIQAPTPPVLEVCQKVEYSDGVFSEDRACASRNKQKQTEYNYAVQSYNSAQNMISSDSASAVKPTEPIYATCATDDIVCNTNNNKLRSDYNAKMQTYNIVQNEQAAAAQQQTIAQQQMATVNNSTTTGVLSELENKNNSASNTYQNAAQQLGTVATALNVAYAGTCATPSGCQQPLQLASAAMSLLQGIAGNQASENANSAYVACTSYNATAAAQKDCSVASVTTDPNVLLDKNFDSNGKCIGDTATCNSITSSLPKGISVNDVRNALAKKTSTPYKVNPDGSITTSDGKTYKASDFASEDAMKAAGIPASVASAVAKMLKSNALASAAKDLEQLNSHKLSLASGLSTTSSGSSNDANNSAIDALKLGSKDDNKTRTPANAGLVKNFNGESIGVSGDDIFIMMNRRYKLKISQDTFIGQ